MEVIILVVGSSWVKQLHELTVQQATSPSYIYQILEPL